MATYRIEWKSSAVRELKQLDRQMIPRVFEAVQDLGSNPFPSGVRKLRGGEHSYRIRVGDYRIIYEVYEKESLVEVSRVRHRREVYRT